MPDPVSFCRMMMKSGMQITTATFIKSPAVLIEKEYSLITRARARAVAILANSTGCTRSDPNSNHAFAPLTSRPKSSAATSSAMPPR